MNITSRPATEADRELTGTVHHRAYRNVVTRQFGPWDEVVQDGYFERGWSPAEVEIVLLDGQACGFTAVDERTDDVFLRELVIDPDCQGRGVGTMMLRQVMGRAMERGVPVRLQVLHLNRAQELYKRVGFRESGRTDTHVLMEWRA